MLRLPEIQRYPMIETTIVTARPRLIRCAAVIAAALATPAAGFAQEAPPPDQVSAIAEEAAVYALPMVMDYGVMYEYALD